MLIAMKFSSSICKERFSTAKREKRSVAFSLFCSAITWKYEFNVSRFDGLLDVLCQCACVCVKKIVEIKKKRRRRREGGRRSSRKKNLEKGRKRRAGNRSFFFSLSLSWHCEIERWWWVVLMNSVHFINIVILLLLHTSSKFHNEYELNSKSDRLRQTFP